MPVRASALLTRTIDIPTPEGDITVTYRRPSVRDYDAIAAAERDAPQDGPRKTEDILRGEVIPLLVGWDVVDDAGQPWPLTPENVIALLSGDEVITLTNTVLTSGRGADPNASAGPSSTGS
jgi:hypothetical protein